MFTNVQAELRQALEAELRGVEGMQLLGEVTAEASLPATMENWSALEKLLHSLGPKHPTHDRVLTACFARRDTSPEKARVVESALLVLFWPMLKSVHCRKEKLETDAETRWSEVFFAFLRAIRRFSLDRRNEHISGKIYNDLLHDFYRACSKRRELAEREIAHDPEEMRRMADEKAHAADVTSSDRRDIIVEFLHRQCRAGNIDDIERDLLVAILADGLTVKDAAVRVGISYEAGKKRKQRAEKAITSAIPAGR